MTCKHPGVKQILLPCFVHCGKTIWLALLALLGFSGSTAFHYITFLSSAPPALGSEGNIPQSLPETRVTELE